MDAILNLMTNQVQQTPTPTTSYPARSPATRLVPLTGFKSFMIYYVDRLPGSMAHPFASPLIFERLTIAARALRDYDPSYEILVWDAYRTTQTQEAILQRYVDLLQSNEAITFDEARSLALNFVSDPRGTFPHGTGGAVDISLMRYGQPLDMGTTFDDFMPESAPDWYINNVPRTDAELEISKNRGILKGVMDHAGFVGIDSEWWHFEYGTNHWARQTNKPATLHEVLPPPTSTSLSLKSHSIPMRQPILAAGAAQPFPDAEQRSNALIGIQPGHYYARTSHPTETGLCSTMELDFPDADDIILAPSGLAAVSVALRALAIPGSTILYDHKLYYECEQLVLAIAKDRSCQAIPVDVHNYSTLEQALIHTPNIHTLILDNPRNWWLDTLSLDSIVALAGHHGVVPIIDTTLQPLQRIANSYPVVTTMSLSKYPSAGMTLGGAIVAAGSQVGNAIRRVCEVEGVAMAPEVAYTVWSGWLSLRDRLEALSDKAEQLAQFLREHRAISSVHKPDKEHCGGLIGGQVSFETLDARIAEGAERIVGSNSITSSFALSLTCTFGAQMTTFEHFASNPRARCASPNELASEKLLPPNMVRIGIGHEPIARIVDSIDFVLSAALRRERPWG